MCSVYVKRTVQKQLEHLQKQQIILSLGIAGTAEKNDSFMIVSKLN